MIYGYAPVSTDPQHLSNQVAELSRLLKNLFETNLWLYHLKFGEDPRSILKVLRWLFSIGSPNSDASWNVPTICNQKRLFQQPVKAARCATMFREKMTGTRAERPELNKLMAKLDAGHLVIIPAVDRLSCEPTDLLVIAREIQLVGAGLRSIAEPVVDITSDFAELMLVMLERRRIIERITCGQADVKANGVVFGRKPKLTPH